MTRAELLALAARAEAAEGADRELDADVWNAAMPAMAPYYDRSDAPAFSASLDAAASLVRLSKSFIATMGDIAADGLPGVCLCISADPVKHVWGISTGGGADPDGRLARAMTAAALRAMAEEAPDV